MLPINKFNFFPTTTICTTPTCRYPKTITLLHFTPIINAKFSYPNGLLNFCFTGFRVTSVEDCEDIDGWSVQVPDA